MTSNTCRNSSLFKHGISIVIQVTFVFIFLTVFFFAYVQDVEKQEFQNQLDLIVDNIMDDVESDMPNLLDKQSDISPENAAIILSGILNVMEEKVSSDAKKNIAEIQEKNFVVKQKALHSLILFVTIVICIVALMFMLNFCIPLSNQIKDAMLAVIFVGLTELVFLHFIVKKYITADPNQVKRTLSQAVQKWIQKNHKI